MTPFDLSGSLNSQPAACVSSLEADEDEFMMDRGSSAIEVNAPHTSDFLRDTRLNVLCPRDEVAEGNTWSDW